MTGILVDAAQKSGAPEAWHPAIDAVWSHSFGIAVFKTHAWPGGPATFGGIAVAAAWLEWESAHGGTAATG